MHDEVWLVKSSGRILGPFTLEELIQHLRARTLSIIDEVRDPMTRWSFIREHPLLKDVVRQLREEDESHIDATQTTFVGRTMTLSVTETTGQEGEFTPNPVTPVPTFQNRSTDARPIAAVERTVRPSVSNRNAFGSLQDSRVQDQIAKKHKTTRMVAWVLTGVLMAGVGWFLYLQKRNREMAQDMARQYIQVAHEQIRFGRMDKALEFYQKAAAVIPLPSDDLVLRAELVLQVAGQPEEAQNILKDPALKKNREPRMVRELGLARTLIAMKTGQWSEAAVEVNSLAGSFPGDPEILHNMALLQYYSRHPVTAWQTISSFSPPGPQAGLALLLKGFLALDWPEKNSEAVHVNQVSEELKSDLENNFELRFEKSLLLMNLRLKAGKMDDVLKVLAAMWKADPMDSRNFLMPLAVDQQLLGWDRLFPLCEKIFSAVPDHESARALRSVCLYQKGDTATALLKIDESRKQLSQSPLLAAVQSLLYFNVGRASEAKTLIQLAGREPLGKLVMGQICQSDKDWSCAGQAWSQVLNEDPKNPMALFGQAFVAKQRGNDLSSRELLRNAVSVSPNYRPFLEFRSDANVF